MSLSRLFHARVISYSVHLTRTSPLPAKSYFIVQNLFSRLELGLGLGLGVGLGRGLGLGIGLGLE